jgi:hypothetical protein
MTMRFFALCGVAVLTACVAPSPTPRAAPAAAAVAREEFVFASTRNTGSYKYACTPGAQGGGTAARAAATHAAFDQALAGFGASQTAAAAAALAAGRSGTALQAEMTSAGDAFAAEQRATLDAQYGCAPGGQA